MRGLALFALAAAVVIASIALVDGGAPPFSSREPTRPADASGLHAE